MRTIIVLGAVLMLSSIAFVPRGLAGPAQSGQSGPAAAAQNPHDHQHAAPPEAKPPAPGGRRQMMMKDTATDDLTPLVARMNAATGEAKTSAMAELLTRLVQQQTTKDELMKAMKSECSMMKKADADQHPEH